MRKLSATVFLVILFFSSCDKDDFFYVYPELDKLLVSVTRIDANSEFRTEFKYDSINRLVELKNIFPEGQIVTESYSYDEKGKLTEKRNGNYVTTFVYNSANQLVEQNVGYALPGDEYSWKLKTEFQYKNGKISKGIVYSEDSEVLQYNNYRYDSRGNTLEKTVHSPNSDSNFNLIEIKFEYDTKVNPNAASGVNMLSGYTFAHDVDIVQVNNPVYSSYLNMVSSSLPPEFEISYEYNSKGLPVKATMNNLVFPDQEPIELEYEYQDIENN